MAETYVVDINIDELRLHRSRVERREVSEAEVRTWLISYGFYPRIDGQYLAEEALVRQLQPGVIAGMWPVIDMPQ